jgi:hypothetical protein
MIVNPFRRESFLPPGPREGVLNVFPLSEYACRFINDQSIAPFIKEQWDRM